MADPFRKTQPGQKLSISSRAWNRLLDTTARPNLPRGQGFAVPAPPSVRGAMRWSGTYGTTSERAVFGQVWTFGDDIAQEFPEDTPVEATLPAEDPWEPSDAEKRLLTYWAPAGTPVLADPFRETTTVPFAICVDPRRMEFVFAGLAWARVRVFAASHQFARLPGRINDTTQESSDARGCLDSAFFGPARIVGYLVDGPHPPRIMRTIPPIESPDFVCYWALVKF